MSKWIEICIKCCYEINLLKVMSVCELKSYFACISHLFTFLNNKKTQKESFNSLCNRLFILLMDKYQWSVTFETRDLLKNVWEFFSDVLWSEFCLRCLIFLANQWSFTRQKTINGPMLFWLSLFHISQQMFHNRFRIWL